MRALIATGALVIAVSTALATGTVTDGVRDTLTQIDSIATRTQLDTAFQNLGDPLTNLSTIARDADVDVGVRLRAVHALGKYCASPCDATDLAHTSLTQLIVQTRDATVGEDVVLLRAAIETLGTLEVPPDVNLTDTDLLVPLLDHPSRDIRAATARALRDHCSSQGVVPLRVRYTAEPTEQVKLAISEALRILQQCGQ